MSIRLETERIKNAKASLKTVIDSKLETPIPESATLDQYPTYVEQLAAAGGGDQINEQLSSQITKLRIAPSEKGTVKLQWEIPDDALYAGADISWAREDVPTFPISEDNIISVNGTENSVTIEGLEEDVLYGFVVMAKNGNGTRNTASTSNNTVLGYVSKEEVFYEVDIPEDLGTSLRFDAISEMNLLFVSSTSSSYPNGCYVFRNGEWQKIIETGYYYMYVQGFPVQGLVFISSYESAVTGLWVYNVINNTCTQISIAGYRWYTIILNDGTILGSYYRTDGIYKIDIGTNTANRINSSYSIIRNNILYETEDYAFLDLSTSANNSYSALVRFHKATNVFTKIDGVTNTYYTWHRRGNFLYCNYFYSSSYEKEKALAEDYTQLSNAYQGKIYLFNSDTGDCTKCIDSTDSGYLVYLNNMWVYATSSGIYTFNYNTNVFELLVTPPEGYTALTNGRWCTFDNDLFFVGNLYDGSSNIPGGLYKWNTTTNTLDLICARTYTSTTTYYIIYCSNNKMFVQAMSTNKYVDSDFIVYDKTTKIASVIWSGNSHRLFADKKDHAVLFVYSSTSETFLVYKPQTNSLESVTFRTGSRTTYTAEYSNFYNQLELSNGDMILSFTDSPSYNLAISTYKFDANGDFKELTEDVGFDTLLTSEGKDYILSATKAYYYNEETDSLMSDGYLGGGAIQPNKRLNKASNVITVYDTDRITQYNTLEGNYSAVIAYTGYAYSSTSAKVLVALN